MIEGLKVTQRSESIKYRIESIAKAIAEVMTSDIVMDIEEPTHSTETVLSIFAGYGGLGFKLCEERPLDCPPSEKARSLATYARLACRQAFPNINKTEADKMAAALLALLAWLVDHLPKASDTELAMHLFGQASHISPKYFAEHLPYTLLQPYENMAEEMAGWLLNNAVDAETPPEHKAVPQSEKYWYVDKAIKERNIEALKAYKESLTHQLVEKLDTNTQQLIQHISAAIIELTQPNTQCYKIYGNYNAHVDQQTNMGLPAQQTISNPSATA